MDGGGKRWMMEGRDGRWREEMDGGGKRWIVEGRDGLWREEMNGGGKGIHTSVCR